MPDENCLHSRIKKVEGRLETHDKRITELKDALHENTQLTRQIVDNTGELVELFKGAKMFRKFVLWASPLILAIVAAWQWLGGGK